MAEYLRGTMYLSLPKTLKPLSLYFSISLVHCPNLRSPKIEGLRMKHNNKPKKNTINIARIVDKTLNLWRTLTLVHGQSHNFKPHELINPFFMSPQNPKPQIFTKL